MISDRSSTRRGFTLVEIVVVLGVLGLILGAAVPLVSAFVDQRRLEEVRAELRRISDALEAYYSDHAGFPRSLDAPDFLGVYLPAGVDDTAIHDGFGGTAPYGYGLSRNPDIAYVTSRGENGRYERGRGDDLRIKVPGAPSGASRTRSRIRLIVAALAEFLDAGGTLTGNWKADLAAMGLGAPYDRDGFGTLFRLNKRTFAVQSAGPDRRFGTKDDITS